MKTIKIQFLLFGACREAVDLGELDVDLALPADVATAWAQLKQQYPLLAGFDRSVLFAVNEDHVNRTHPLRDGDVLAVFPPVSGG